MEVARDPTRALHGGPKTSANAARHMGTWKPVACRTLICTRLTVSFRQSCISRDGSKSGCCHSRKMRALPCPRLLVAVTWFRYASKG
jgi:hypothetical protein